MVYNSIHPGKRWLDTAGKPIQAHGFTVFYDEAAKEYKWFGEDKGNSRFGGTVWHWGVRLYISKDLYNWENRGHIISPKPDDLSSPLHPTYCMDRPHILYCKRTGKYVAWLKIMGGLVSQFMMILTADRLEGPYTTVREVYHPLDMDSGDFTLHADEETGKAYIFFERPHFQLICATLTDDYTACTGEYSVHYDGLKPPYTREAPTFFTHEGRKYLITSGTTGYFPNQSRVCVFDDYHGEYTDLGDPFVGDTDHTSFSSQVSCVLSLPKSGKLIACADRWMPFPWVGMLARHTQRRFEKIFADYQPDLSLQTAGVSGKKNRYFETTRLSRYVWLPIEWDGEKPVIRWVDEWKV
ncbi:MAG: family 43 glycosylhydrolase [Anaerolineaceae bacterium]|nr:family 43 glycosylhydrolase [Anaerolineaceae bacterium]